MASAVIQGAGEAAPEPEEWVRLLPLGSEFPVQLLVTSGGT